jgi:hypothetical protein
MDKQIGVYAPHKPDYDHLLLVCEEMKKLGSPVIHAVEFDGQLLAIEGSHRLCAAYLLNVPVEIVKIDLEFCLLPNRPARVVLEKWGWGAHKAFYYVRTK